MRSLTRSSIAVIARMTRGMRKSIIKPFLFRKICLCFEICVSHIVMHGIVLVYSSGSSVGEYICGAL